MSDQRLETILGGYEILSLLGQGGMARVYLARQASLDRQVALKVIQPDLQSDASVVERFRRERSILKSLQHPHILPIYDSGEEDGLLWIAMQLVPAGTMQDLLTGQPMQLASVSVFLQQVAGALSYAHRRGIIHRDLKPANILLDDGPHLYLADFGIAKLLEGSNLTTTGSTLGTPAYMAPEQVLNGKLDGRTDIYALGVMTYQMVTGLLPFEGPLHSVLYSHCNSAPAPPQDLLFDLPTQVNLVILKALEKEPDRRFSDAQELADAFSAAVEGRQREAAQLLGRGAWEEAPQDPPEAELTQFMPPRRRPWLGLAGMTLALCSGLAGAAHYHSQGQGQGPSLTHSLVYNWGDNQLSLLRPNQPARSLGGAGAARFWPGAAKLCVDFSGDIACMSLDSEQHLWVTGDPNSLDFWGSVSPDQKDLVFHSNRGGRFQLYRQPLKAGRPEGAPQRLTADRGEQKWASFSSDGRWLAYSNSQDGEQSIWVRPYPAGSPRKLSHPGKALDCFCAWSPDQSQLVFERQNDQQSHLVVVDFANAKEYVVQPKTQLSPPHQPSWAPSPFIAFACDQGIFALRPDTQECRKLVESQGGLAFPNWGPQDLTKPQGP